MIKYFSQSVQDTQGVGIKCAQALTPNALVCFFGELGAGKTTLIKSIISELTNTDPHKITSPTFTYVNTYSGKCICHHFDLYRLAEVHDFNKLGFDEYLDSENAYSMIEWPERITPLLTHRPTSTITLRTLSETQREIIFKQ